MSLSEPHNFDDLDRAFAKIWDVIEEGAGKRTSPAHTPVVGTVGLDRTPELRVMVLRHAARHSRLLRFHTDSRSTKMAEIGAANAASVLVYHPEEKLQVRLRGNICALSNEAEVDTIWQASTPFARRCYLAEAPPGTPTAEATSGLPSWIEGKKPDERQLSIMDARGNFAVLQFETTSVESLYLASSGHRRARWDWSGATGVWSASWLVP